LYLEWSPFHAVMLLRGSRTDSTVIVMGSIYIIEAE
jgi:hypothetical protein